MLDWFKVKSQYLLPKHPLSRLVGALAAAEAGAVTTSLIKLFIRQYQVNMDEARYSDAEDYNTFNDFFSRELKDGARPILEDADKAVFPVDGTVSQSGAIEYDSIFQAKGHNYSLTSLLGGKPVLAAAFKNGNFATIYLSPSDYHRIHMPLAGKLTDMLHVPGELFSVNPLTTENVPGLFARNERVVCLFDTEFGKMALVLVGATIVASIETPWAGTVTPPAGKTVQHWQYPASGAGSVDLAKGEEMGRFKLGSTVVACFEPGMLEFAELSPGMTTRMGEHFASTK